MGFDTSVVICTYNRAELLRRLLRALEQQSLGPDRFEVIVADDGSGDHTAQICQQLTQRLPLLCHITTGANRGSAAARNLGFARARGERVLFTDDDCIPRPDWVERMRRQLEDHAIVVGAVDIPPAAYATLCHNISQFHAYLPGRPARPVQFLSGANMGFRRDVLARLGGFAAGRRVAFDTEVGLRAQEQGYQLAFAPDAVVEHCPQPIGLVAAHRYAYRHAAETIKLRTRYRSVLHTPWLLQSPAALLASAPLIALHVVSLLYARNPALLRRASTIPALYSLKLAWCLGAAAGLRRREAERAR